MSTHRARISERTFLWDRLRGACQGLLESVWGMALVVAIRVFDADDSLKQLLPASVGFGLVLGPLSLALFTHTGLRLSRLIAGLWVAAGLLFCLAANATSAIGFIAVMVLAQMVLAQGTQLITPIYSSNYDPSERGRRLSSTLIVVSLVGILTNPIGGRMLDLDLGWFRWIFLAGGIVALAGSLIVVRIPSPRIHRVNEGGILEHLGLIFKDRLFFWMLAAWMLMGIGNLMTIPLRVEYLANPAYGVQASNLEIAIIIAVIPAAFRLLSTRFWGILFDRLNLITLRNLLNAVFGLSIFLFFTTTNLWVMALAAALLGVGFGGGGIVWTLWVTKIARPEKVAAYMSIHGFTTGIRQALAPFLIYALIGHLSPFLCAMVAVFLVILASCIFLPLRHSFQGPTRSQPAGTDQLS